MRDHQCERRRVKSGDRPWAPRFVSNGVALTDFEEVARRFQVWDQWWGVPSLVARASIHEVHGPRRSTQETRECGETCMRAGVYYHLPSFSCPRSTNAHSRHMKAVELPDSGAAAFAPAGERVEIPYDGKKLLGILRKPPGIRRQPIGVRRVDLTLPRKKTSLRAKKRHPAPAWRRSPLTARPRRGASTTSRSAAITNRGQSRHRPPPPPPCVDTRNDVDASRLECGASVRRIIRPRAPLSSPHQGVHRAGRTL